MGLRFQKGDVISIVLVVLLAITVFLAFLPGNQDAAVIAEVYLDGELVETLSLDEPREIVLKGVYSNTVTIRDGKVSVTASDCPGEDCVHSGWIGASGRSIVCLPNGLEIRVVGKTDDVDFVVG